MALLRSFALPSFLRLVIAGTSGEVCGPQKYWRNRYQPETVIGLLPWGQGVTPLSCLGKESAQCALSGLRDCEDRVCARLLTTAR